jgi:myo-inositol-1(or 4)-monophosphatase
VVTPHAVHDRGTRGDLVEAPPLHADARWAAAVRLARAGGAMARERFQHAQVAWKADESMVTDADLAIQARLADELASAFPDDGVLGEEGVPPGPCRLDAAHVWVLDPVDGTNNFGRGIPGFSVSVGVLREGEPYAGAVYDPIADQLFTACDGHGAWLGSRRLRVEPMPLGRRSLVSIRTPYDEVPAFVADWLTRYRLRRFGSTALQLCYVALGALAFVHDDRTSLWDIAGAAPVLLEAGAALTAPDGRNLFPVWSLAPAGEPMAILAGDPLAHLQATNDVRAARSARRP